MRNEKENTMILGQDNYFSMDCHKTQLNNNVIVVGTSGSGKTRSVVMPNIHQAAGSYVISDPKGNLYEKLGPYLRKRGYKVRKLDFTNPSDSCHYNFFNYISSDEDVRKISRMIIYADRKDGTYSGADPFWDKSAEILLEALIGFLVHFPDKSVQNFKSITKLLNMAEIDENDCYLVSNLDKAFYRVEKDDPESTAVKKYKYFKLGAAKTMKSILITLASTIGAYDTPAISELINTDDVDLTSIGREKTALFVVVSDTDRSLDGLVNIFFTQAMNVLCQYADRQCKNNSLPIHVRFILDDFATNVRIEDCPRMISSIRSRNISMMLLLQAESQLESYYGPNGKTIISNCDSYLYLGTNDIETAQAVAKRCDLPLKKVLYMPVGKNILFRRGQEPVFGINYDPDRRMRDSLERRPA